MSCARLLKVVRPVSLALGVGALVLSGCAGGGSGLGMGTSGYTVSSNDACAGQRAQLKSYQTYFYQSMAEGALAGAAVGATAGALIGGNWKAALIGAGTGAVVGAAGGYLVAKQRATSDPVQLTQSVYQDISTENGQIDAVTASFLALKNCRFQTAELVKNDYQAGRMSREAAQAKLAEIRGLFNEDVAFAEALDAKINERGGEYQYASTELTKLQPPPAPPPPAPAPAKPAAKAAPAAKPPSTATASSGSAPVNSGGVAQLTATNQLKRKALSDDVQEAKAGGNAAFDLEGKISHRPTSDDSPAS